ncbi:MAG: orotidine 5'-phosphate decarboxylase, partial [Desulfohalobiaceae bacterium]|nr:orotidine 5'-phosphate decarboxylase [Desulfohalobiaceae bacterium]
EAPLLRKHLGSSLCIVTPGVRPISNTEHHHQKRIVDPATAIRQGADHIVVGRPLRRASDPLAVAAHMQQAIQEVLEDDSIQTS